MRRASAALCRMCVVMVPLLVFLLSGTAILDPASAADAPSLEQVKKVWRQRQKKFSSAQITFVMERKTSQFDVLNSAEKAKVMQDPAAVARLKSELLTGISEAQVTIGGARMKDDLQIRQRVSPREAPRSLHAFYGTTHESYGEIEGDRPWGNIYDANVDDRRVAMENPMLVPIVWTFGDWEYLLSLASKVRMRAASADTMVDSQPCVVLEYSRGGDCTFSFWLDPAEDYAVRRHTVSNNGRVRSQLDCRYDRSPEGCWTPVEWTHTAERNDSGPRVAHSRVTAYTINSASADDAYAIAFPPGTVVHIRRPYHFEDYVVRPDGSKEILMQAIREPPTQRRYGHWILAACFVLMALCGGLFYVHRRRRVRGPIRGQ